jgi:hypothetical protein
MFPFRALVVSASLERTTECNQECTNVANKSQGVHERKGMSRAVSFALLAGGILLIVFGVMASTSLSSDISRFFTGSPTDKAIWMLVGGVVASVVGLVGLSRG